MSRLYRAKTAKRIVVKMLASAFMLASISLIGLYNWNLEGIVMLLAGGFLLKVEQEHGDSL